MSSLDKYKHSPTKSGSDTSDWNSPIQSNPDMGREKLRKDDSALGYPKPKDISRRVDGADDNSGFSGKLPKGE
jgi:hypothetical protein